MKIKFTLFEFYIFLITLFKTLGYNSNDWVYVLVFLFGFAVVVYKLYSDRVTLNELLAMLLIVGIGFANWVVGGATTILTTAIALCGLKNVDTVRIIKVSFWTRIVAFAAMVALSSTGIIDSEVVSFYRDGEYIDRYKFGYGHPNNAHMMFAVIVLLAVYLYGKRMNVLHYVAVILSNQILFHYTGSRTGYLVILLSLAIYLLFALKITRKTMMRLSKHMYLILFFITLMVGFGYGRVGFLDTVNVLTTGRINYINRILMEQIPPVFGQSEYFDILIDNGYMKLLYVGGWLVFGWFSYYIIKMTNKMYRENRYNELFLIMCILIYNMGEAFVDAISVNVSLVFLGEVMFKNRKTFEQSTFEDS